MKKNLRKRFIRVAIAVAGIATVGIAAKAEAQIQLTPDSRSYLIQRTVGAEEWAISYNFDAGTLTGNVFKTNGAPPSFIWCEFVNIDYADDPSDNQYFLDCLGADACTTAPCEPSAWVDIGQNIPLPASFVLPPGTQSTFTGNVNPTFTASCAMGGCHDPITSSAGLDLSPGAAYDNIVDMMSTQMVMLNRVEPFDANASYLLSKLTGEGSGSLMPIGGMLSDQQIDWVRNWILEGAARN
ncbi:MAG: hypothetical protein P8R42_30115 [Candidatus Binatia bacterium]|nr:hypothetical protein [Candidatus Binatia bacterium]